MGRDTRRVGPGRDAGRGPGQRLVRHGRRARAPGRTRRGRRRAGGPVGRRAGCGADGREGRTGTRAGGPRPRRRPTDPPGGCRRLRRRLLGDGPGVDHGHPVVHPTDDGLPVGRGDRRGRRRQPDRGRLQRGPGIRRPRPRSCLPGRSHPGGAPAGCHQGPVGPIDGGVRPADGHDAPVHRLLRPVRRGGGQGPLVLRRPRGRTGRPPRPDPGGRSHRRPGLRGRRL